MSEILNLDDLGEIEANTKTVELPVLSGRLGKPVSVEIKPIAPTDLLKLYDVPLDEINALAAEDDVEAKAGALIQEQMSAYSEDDYKRMIESGIKFSVVNPEPTENFMKHVEGDSMMLFTEIMKLSTGGVAAEDAARFREDGELAGD